jgi:hypothetical protein
LYNLVILSSSPPNEVSQLNVLVGYFFTDGNQYRLVFTPKTKKVNYDEVSHFDTQFEVRGTLGPERKISVTRIRGLDAPDRNEATNQLTRAIADGDLDGVRRALASGADPNVGPTNTSSLLSLFAMRREDSIVPIAHALIDSGANVNAADSSGFTTLHLASRFANRELGEVLVLAGADVNGVGEMVWPGTPLGQVFSQTSGVIPATSDRGKLASLLLEHGARLTAEEDARCFGQFLRAFVSGQPPTEPIQQCDR